MSVVVTITMGLYSAATAFANSDRHRLGAQYRLQIVALRFAAGMLRATAEAGTRDACLLLEQLAQDIESRITI